MRKKRKIIHKSIFLQYIELEKECGEIEKNNRTSIGVHATIN